MCICLLFKSLLCVSVFSCIFYICNTSLYSVVLSMFAVVYYLVELWILAVSVRVGLCVYLFEFRMLAMCVYLICKCLQHISIFSCLWISISTFFIVLVMFVIYFYIWLHCECLQPISVFSGFVNACCPFLHLIVYSSIWSHCAIFAAHFFIWLHCECF